MFLNKTVLPFWQEYLEAQQKSELPELPDSLERIAKARFVQLFGALVLEPMIPSSLMQYKNLDLDFDSCPNEWRESSVDKTGFERLLSKIHIDGRVEHSHFVFAIAFLKRIFETFNEQFPNQKLRGIVSIDNDPDSIFSCCVFYHVKRVDEYWLVDDIESGGLENYSEGVFVVDSDEFHQVTNL